MTQNQLPAHLQGHVNRALADRTLDHLGIGSPPYISIMGNKFQAVDTTGARKPVGAHDPQLGVYLDCVVVDMGDVISKIYYATPFDPSGDWVPPDCWSDNGVAPSRNAAVPQSRTCGECPNNAWGSAVSKVTGKGIKACADYQKLAISIPGDPIVYLLRVPPNSLVNLRGYLQKFKGQNVDVDLVITRLSFQQDTLGTLEFRATSYVDEATYAFSRAALAEKRTDALVGRLDRPRTEMLAAPAEQRQIPPTHVSPPLTSQMRTEPQPPGIPQGATSPGTPAVQRAPVAETAPKRPGRPKRQTAEQPAAPAGFTPAPFRAEPQGTGQAASPSASVHGNAAAPTGNGQQPGSQFGIQSGAAPDAALSNALDSIFK